MKYAIGHLLGAATNAQFLMDIHICMEADASSSPHRHGKLAETAVMILWSNAGIRPPLKNSSGLSSSSPRIETNVGPSKHPPGLGSPRDSAANDYPIGGFERKSKLAGFKELDQNRGKPTRVIMLISSSQLVDRPSNSFSRNPAGLVSDSVAI